MVPIVEKQNEGGKCGEGETRGRGKTVGYCWYRLMTVPVNKPNKFDKPITWPKAVVRIHACLYHRFVDTSIINSAAL
jgi:hypothetical protein